MKARHHELEARVAELLGDPAHAGHPLSDALREVWEHMSAHVQRLERITALSDSYQSMARQRELGVCDRFEQQLRRVNRIVRISDQYQHMLQELNARLAAASNRDPLTDAPNRRVLMARLRDEAARASRSRAPFVVAMLDVDHFKSINDRHGHDAGDRVLVEVSRVLCAGLRACDLCGRWGGEEFLLILPDTTLADGRIVLERKLDEVRSMRVEVEGSPIALTVSAGIAESQPDEALSSLLGRADAALYRAKQEGRDRLSP